jgi:hypothetical protein
MLEKLAFRDERLANNEPWELRFHLVPSSNAMLQPLTRRKDGGIDGETKFQVRDSEVALLFTPIIGN